MKLSAHMIPVHFGETDQNQLRRIQPKSIKLIDFHPARTRQIHQLSPRSLMVLRNHPLSEQHSDVFNNPEATGQRHAEQWIADLEKWQLPIPRDQIVVLGINEFPIWHDDDPQKRNTPRAHGITLLNRYSVAFGQTCATAKLRFGLGSINTGWPANDGPNTPPNWTPLEPIRNTLRNAWDQHKITGFLMLHEYWPKTGPESVWPWNAGRYTQCPWNVPIIIGECGLSQRVVDPSIPESQSGWLQFSNPDAYTKQLLWYDSQLQKDRRVHSAQIFTWDAFPPFVSSDDIRGLLHLLPKNEDFDHMTAFYGVTPPTPDPTPPTPPPTPPTPTPKQTLIWPLENMPLTQHFVGNYDWYKSVSKIGHNGTDWGAPIGTPIRAVANGVVQWVGSDPPGWGHYIRIYHEILGFHSFYAHLDKPSSLTRGATVTQGQTIGVVGNTGRSTGPHLHYSVRLAQKDGMYVSTAFNSKGYVDPVLFHNWVNEHGKK